MTRRLRAIPALFVVAVVAVGGLLAQPAGASAPTPIPQWNAAQAAASYLASQFTPQGFIPVSGSPSTPNYSDTAQSIIALAAANADRHLAQTALAFFTTSTHADDYVSSVDGADGPGQLAILILAATSQGYDPRFFIGSTNLVTRLLATQQTSGPDAGLFGTETQAAAFAAGTYQQGLALAALASAGVTSGTAVSAGVSWLAGQQCPNGGWSLPDAALDPCSGLPADFAGPDTNSTSLAVQGLAAEHALSAPVATAARNYFIGGQDADAGWSYYANTPDTPAATDPDSTALVLQALTAMGLHPSDLTKGASDPLSTLLSFQLHSGAGQGGFYFPPAPAPASNLATYQAMPALVGVALPVAASLPNFWVAYTDGAVGSAGSTAQDTACGAPAGVNDVVGIASSPAGVGYWLVGHDGGIFGCGAARFFGSLPGLGLRNQAVAGLAPTADGGGYWLVSASGGVFAFGDARYRGSLPGLGITGQTVVALVPTADDQGYLLVSSTGGVFAFGSARFAGSLPGAGVNVHDVVGLVPTADSRGYWVIAADGGVFALGDASFLGSLPSVGAVADVVGVSGVVNDNGYLLVSSDANTYAFGGALFATPGTRIPTTGAVGVAIPSKIEPCGGVDAFCES